MLEILAREHREDVHRLVGILRGRAGALHALEDPPLRRVARRMPWLLIGLGLSFPLTGVMAAFENVIQANVTVAFFIPAIIYLTDAIGTQTEAVAVRALSASHAPLREVIGGEAVTGALIGLVLGTLAFAAIMLGYGEIRLAIAVAASLALAGTLASVIGLLLPWLLSWSRIDPAFGSGPVATILQDALTIIVYFAVVSAVYAGT